jgi:hypothetical protein
MILNASNPDSTAAQSPRHANPWLWLVGIIPGEASERPKQKGFACALENDILQ